MQKQESRKVLVTIQAEKYLLLRHQLIDRRETFNGLVNKLIDQHITKTNRERNASLLKEQGNAG